MTQKSSAALWSIVILVVLAGATAFMFWGGNLQVPDEADSQSFANTYSNTKHGYSFDYPDNTKPVDVNTEEAADGSEDVVHLIKAPDVLPAGRTPENFPYGAILTLIVKPSEGKDLDTIVGDLTAPKPGIDAPFSSEKTGERTIANQRAVWMEVCGIPGCFNRLYFVHSGSLFEVSHLPDTHSDSEIRATDRALFEDVIDTFTFTQ